MGKLRDLFENARDNVTFLLLCALIVAVIIAIAYAAEVIIAKKKQMPRRDNKLKVKRITVIAMLSALAIILMLFEIPLWFTPSFYQIDLSEVPIVIGSFMLGPIAAVTMEFLKIVLNLFINGTKTAFVGEFANFLIGCCLVVPASICYYAKKTKKNAILGLVLGTFIMTVVGCLLNAYVLLPKYAEAFHMPIEQLIAAGTAVNKGITDLFTFCAFAVAPFNAIKGMLVAIVTLLIYKRVSRILTAKN